MIKEYSVDVVIPCYHEEEALPFTAPIILNYLRDLLASGRVSAKRFRMILVDDGSVDATWPTILELSRGNPEVAGLKLSRNYGHQSAMLAGLSRAEADVVITMDADLQDDINAIEQMLFKYEAGYEVVFAVRENRDSDTRFKRGTANGYYRLLSLMGVKVIENHGDYRLTSRRALRALLAHNEVNLFLRGIVPTIGFKSAMVHYARRSRELGTSKYTLRKMLTLAIDGITSFTISPLRIIAALGAIFFALSVVAATWVLVVAIFFPWDVVPGWASTTLPILFFGGANLLSLGILGEYIGKIYMETKQRPRFFEEEFVASASERAHDFD